jgi:predicted nucleotidyltransferase
MSPPDLTLVREFKQRAEQALPGHVVRVVLYGSRARGDARPDYDWDIAVFVDRPPTPQDRRVLSDIGFDLMMESGQHFQTVAQAEPIASEYGDDDRVELEKAYRRALNSRWRWRCQSRSLMAWRLSCACLPVTSAISILARPLGLK